MPADKCPRCDFELTPMQDSLCKTCHRCMWIGLAVKDLAKEYADEIRIEQSSWEDIFDELLGVHDATDRFVGADDADVCGGRV